MNISHRSIWNSSLGAWVAVSEITRARGKRSGGGVLALVLLGASVCSSVGAQPVSIDNGAIVTVPGSQSSPWNVGAQLYVGENGVGTLNITNGGTVTSNDGFIGAFAGTGIVTVSGAGSTWASPGLYVGVSFSTGNLTVANGGQVSVNNGTGRIDITLGSPAATGVVNIGAAPASAAQAAGTVAAGEVRFGTGTGSLNFNHTDTAYTFSTLITGPGVLNQYAGTTILTGANTYSGGTTISGGTLQGNTTSLQGNIANNAAVIFNQAANGTYTGAMSGGGSLTKAATGTLTLTGTNTYSGATNVNAGTLSVNGSIANSAVNVNSGGTLGGNGTLGNTLIASGGILAPGNSIGTLNVNGNL